MIVAGPVLTLDLATLTGFAVGSFADRPHVGSQQFVGGHNGRCLFEFRVWLISMIEFYEPQLVVFEEVMTFNKTQPAVAARLHGLAGMTEAVIEEMNGGGKTIRCRSANPSTVKRFWTGKGNARKPVMVERARVCGFPVLDDNAADAVAIWHYCVKCYGTKEQQDRVDQMLFEAGMGAAVPA